MIKLDNNSAAVLPYLLISPLFFFHPSHKQYFFWPRVAALIISSFSADEMSDAVIFLARSLGLCHSHFPSVMSLRRSCLVTLWCHISSADGSPSPLQHGHRCHNWSPEWISKVASLIRMSPSYPARGFNGLGWSNPSLRHPGDSGRSVWLIADLCRLNNLVQLQFLFRFGSFFPLDFFWRGNKFVRSEWLSSPDCNRLQIPQPGSSRWVIVCVTFSDSVYLADLNVASLRWPVKTQNFGFVLTFTLCRPGAHCRPSDQFVECVGYQVEKATWSHWSWSNCRSVYAELARLLSWFCGPEF